MAPQTEAKRPYNTPKSLVLAKAEEIIHGNGKNWTDTLGNTDTRYGSDTYGTR
ncbi:MAG: hypothetical protein ABI142_06020 [Bryocella sp.]